MIYRKDLIGDEPPKTWDEMIDAAKKCQDENPGVSGLAFHQANGSDAAAVTYNTVNGVYGGNLWNAEDKTIEGVINDEAGPEGHGRPRQPDEAADREGLGQLVHRRGQRRGRARARPASRSSGSPPAGGLVDPEQSTLGKTPEDEILDKLGFATLPTQEADVVPLGGMGMHVSAYAPAERAGRGAQLHEVVRAGGHPEEVGRGRRRAGAHRRARVPGVPRGRTVQQGVRRLGVPHARHVERAGVRQA